MGDLFGGLGSRDGEHCARSRCAQIGSGSNSIAIVLIEAEHCLKRSIFLVLNGCGSATNEGIRYGCGGTRTRALSRCGSTSLCSRCFGSL